MISEFMVIQDGRKFVVIDESGDPKFDSYWENDCHDWIAENECEDWDEDY